MATSIKATELKQAVRAVLKDADLSKMSAKKVRKQLEEKFGQNLTDRKKEIDEMVMDFINNGAQEDEDDSGRENGTAEDASDDESDFEPPEDGEPSPKKRKIEKKNDSDEMDDEKLAQKLQEEEDNGGRRTRGGRSSKKTPVKRKAPKPKSNEDGGAKRKSKGLYGQELILSSSLAEIMGKDRMVRSDVVKKMWEIIKERNLIDPKQRQFMKCDEQLQKVFGRKRVKPFGMMKYLKDHMFKPDEYNDLIK